MGPKPWSSCATGSLLHRCGARAAASGYPLPRRTSLKTTRCVSAAARVLGGLCVSRPYHSASSLALGERCQHAWGLHYLDDIVEPPIAWDDIEAKRVLVGDVTRTPCQQCYSPSLHLDAAQAVAVCLRCGNETPWASPRQRGASIGSAMHALFEAWYRGQSVDWTSTVGQIATAGVRHLPAPDRCHRVEVEASIGIEPTGLDRSPTRMQVHGVWLAGFRDLLAWPFDDEATRLGLQTRSPILFDYKGTSDIAKWAKDIATLTQDTAANAYALDVMLRYRLDQLQCRWVYFQTKGPHAAAPVDFVITLEGARAALREPCRLARELDQLQSSAESPRSPMRCTDYLMPDRRSGGWTGGCEYHCTVGGPCDQLRPLKSFWRLLDRLEQRPMASLKEKFANRSAALVAPPPATEPAAPPIGSAEPPPPTEDTTAPTPAKRSRKPRTASTASASTGDAATFAERKAAAEAKIAEGQAELDSVLVDISAARDALAALLPEAGR
jgi:hypothetical protein